MIRVHCVTATSARASALRWFTVLSLALAWGALMPRQAAWAHLSIIRQATESSGLLEADDLTGYSLAVGDFNGDGYDDLAMGAPHEDVNEVNQGAVIVSFGSENGITHFGAQFLTAALIGQTPQFAAQFGFALAAADFNLDGYSDLLIGAPFDDVGSASSAGQIYVVYGSAGGLGSTSVVYDQTDVGGAPEDDDNFGTSFAVGNFDGDAIGYPDVAVGSPGEDGAAGAVAVNLLGGPLGLTTGVASLLTQESLGVGYAAGDRFGNVLAGGQLSASGHEDLAVGAPYADPSGVVDAGRVYVLLGTSSGITTTGAVAYDATAKDLRQTGSLFGSAVAAGSFFDGGYDGLAIGEPRRNVSGNVGAGRVVVARGTLTGLSFAGTDGRILTENSGGSGVVQAGDEFGSALAAGDYWDGDGYDDVGVGAPKDGLGFTEAAGQFQIFPGGPDGPTGAGWSGFNQGTCNEAIEAGDHFGFAIAFGRFDASNRGSFAVGAPFEDVTNAYLTFSSYQNAGQVHVIAPWRQVFGLTSLTGVMGECDADLLFSVKPFDYVKIASTTKILTVLIACERIFNGLDPATPYTVPLWIESDMLIAGSECKPPLANGETLTLLDLMYMCLRFSGNDAAYAIADVLYGGGGATDFEQFKANVVAFVGEMNTRAAAIGMAWSHFNNPPGTDNPPSWLPTSGGHSSNAYDMWLLGKVALAHPLFAQICGLANYSTVRQNMPYTVGPGYAGAFKDPKVIGLKAGLTPGAKITGVFAARLSGSGAVVGSLFRAPDLPTNLTEAAAMMNMALSQCDPPRQVNPDLVVNQKFGNLGTASGVAHLIGSSFGASVHDDVLLEFHRQTGAAPAAVQLEFGRESQVEIEPGPGAPYGVRPFQSHRGFQVSNLDTIPVNLRIILSAPPGPPLNYVLDPDSIIVIPPLDAPAADFTMTIENSGIPGSTAHLLVRETYDFDVTGIGPPGPLPAFSATLRRAGVGDDGFWARVTGMSLGDPGEVLFSVHDPGVTVAVDEPPPLLGARLERVTPAPNPFHDLTELRFDLAAPGTVEASVHDLLGRRLKRFPPLPMAGGRGRIAWDGRTDEGVPVEPGMYFYRVRLDGRDAASGRIVRTR